MNAKQFVIGVGSQRAGSTLLHRILDECTSVYMNPVKELHYFDSMFDIRHPDYLKDFSIKQLKRELDQLSGSSETILSKKYKNYLRTNFILATKDVKDIDYLDLFRPCVNESKMLGEITPEYMLLSDSEIAYMKSIIGDAKIILLVRDPMERLVSSYKLLHVYGVDDPDEIDIDDEILLEHMQDNTQWIQQQDNLNAYCDAIERYSKHFTDVLVIPYKKIFQKPEDVISQLSDLLGEEIDRDRYNDVIKKKVNALSENMIVSDSLKEKIYHRYEDEYSKLKSYLDDGFDFI